MSPNTVSGSGGLPVLGIVCGMAAEARALGLKPNDSTLGEWAGQEGTILLAVTGARADQAEAAARKLADQGCRLLLSCGVCGGLIPGLSPGTVLRPSMVVTKGERFPLAYGDGETVIAGSDAAVATPHAKAALRMQTGASAVDMESHALVRVASERGLPAAALRIVGDPADRALPPFVADALDSVGRPRLWPVLAGLLGDPRRLGQLLRLKRDTDRALRVLVTEVASGALDQLVSEAEKRPA